MTSLLKVLAVNGAGHPADLGCMVAQLGLILAGSKLREADATELCLFKNLLLVKINAKMMHMHKVSQY